MVSQLNRKFKFPATALITSPSPCKLEKLFETNSKQRPKTGVNKVDDKKSLQVAF